MAYLKITALAILMSMIACGADGNDGTNEAGKPGGKEVKVEFIPATSPMIRYVGRTETANDGSVSFDWTGTYLMLRFTGSAVRMEISSGRESNYKESFFNVWIDGVKREKMRITAAEGIVDKVLAAGLGEGVHTVRVQRCTEGREGCFTIHNFHITGGSVLAPPPSPGRHIEFIGDSHSCGYGVEAPAVDSPYAVSEENCDLTYACHTARAFGADYTLIAHSGQGAVRNYGDSQPVSAVTMRERMMYTRDNGPGDPANMWNFRIGYKPDAVVIMLGENDFSGSVHPSKAQFTTAYLEIVERIRVNYGETVPIICLGPKRGGNALACIQDMCNASDDAHLHFGVSVAGLLDNGTDIAAGHPNRSGQRKIADLLIPRIATITGWETDKATDILPQEL